MLMGTWKRVDAYNALAVTNPLYGIWQVEEFTSGEQMLPPLVTDKMRWQRLIFQQPGRITVQRMNGAFVNYGQTIDSKKKTLSWKSSRGEKVNAELSYSRPQPDVLVLDGQVNGKHMHAMLKKEDRPFLLKTNRFRWARD